MNYLFSDRVTITAKPSARNVYPYILTIYPLALSSGQVKTINIIGKSFYQLKNLYLSSANVSYFNGLNYSYFNPFSSVPNLTNSNPGFFGIVIPTFTILNENLITFDIPDQVFYNKNLNNLSNTYFDVIVENEAGYGLLSRDSYSYAVSSWSGFVNTQKPSISGIFITGY
jgi:hypothetical protein